MAVEVEVGGRPTKERRGGGFSKSDYWGGGKLLTEEARKKG